MPPSDRIAPRHDTLGNSSGNTFAPNPICKFLYTGIHTHKNTPT